MFGKKVEGGTQLSEKRRSEGESPATREGRVIVGCSGGKGSHPSGGERWT